MAPPVAFVVLLVCLSTTSVQGFQKCGVARAALNELIVNGYDSAPWPWHVAIYHANGRSNEYSCGGTLISAEFVLTAKHCVVNPENGYTLAKNRVLLYLGLRYLHRFNSRTQQHPVEQILVPRGGKYAPLRNDIALIKLATSAEINDYVRPACLLGAEPITGEYGTVAGWGYTEADRQSNTLRAARLPVVSFGACLRQDRTGFGSLLDEGMLCAGYTNGTTVCNGDSGGALMFQRGGAWHVGGIVSFGLTRKAPGEQRCLQDGYGVFVNVFAYLPWIRKVTNLRASTVSTGFSSSFSFSSTRQNPRKTVVKSTPKPTSKPTKKVVKQQTQHAAPRKVIKRIVRKYIPNDQQQLTTRYVEDPRYQPQSSKPQKVVKRVVKKVVTQSQPVQNEYNRVVYNQQGQKQQQQQQQQQPKTVKKIVRRVVQQPATQQKQYKVVQQPVVQQKQYRVVQQPATQQKQYRVVQQPLVQQKQYRVVQQPAAGSTVQRQQTIVSEPSQTGGVKRYKKITKITRVVNN